MDHRISKDMISNGMTPSGQRSQQDLSRTQYGSAATPASLAEAYKKISEMTAGSDPGQAAQTSEYRRRALERERKQKMNPDGTPRKPEKVKVGLPRPGAGLLNREHADLFDIVKGHLMGEGLSEEDALKQMLDMTEEEKTEIVEGAPYVVTNADKRGNTPAYQGLMKGAKNKLTGKPLYVAAPHLKGV